MNERKSSRPCSPLVRSAANPILTAADWPYPCNAVFNAGAARLADGRTVLLCRVEDHRGHSHLTVARSAGGIDGWSVDPHPSLTGEPARFPEEIWGLEDPRITWLAELGQFAVLYTAFFGAGPCVSLALTGDFSHFERRGMVLPVENKDAAIFPRRIGGQWLMLHRPVSFTTRNAHLWLSRSQDLVHWGSHELVMTSRPQGWWDSAKIGLGPPPLETPQGWLILYHGVRVTAAGAIYRVGAALLDLENPAICRRRLDSWILSPQADYERAGDVPNVVFPCGWTVADDRDTLFVYYGAADTVMALATGSLRQLLDLLASSPAG